MFDCENKPNVDFKESEFKKGDVIVRIDGFVRYTVVESDPSSPTYKLEFRYGSGEMGCSELDKEYVDEEYVRIDHET